MSKAIFKAAVVAASVALAGCNQTIGGFVRQDSQDDQAPQRTRGAQTERPTSTPPMARPLQSGLYPDKSCEEILKDRSDAGRVWSTVVNTATNLDNTCIGLHVGHKDPETGKIDQTRPVSSVYGRIFLNACQGQNAASSVFGSVVGAFDRKTQLEQNKLKAVCNSELKAVQNFAAAVIRNMEVKFEDKARNEKLVSDVEGTADLTNFLPSNPTRGRTPNVGSFVPQIQIPSVPTPTPSRSRY